MNKRAYKALIGKDIARTGTLVVRGSGANIAEGEIVILDSKFNVMANGTTVVDSPVIYFAEGSSDTYSYVNEAGTPVTDQRKLIISDPIEGKLIKSVKGRSYTAPTEQTYVLTPNSWTPTLGYEYGIRIVYKDLSEKSGQFTHTYRVTATNATFATLVDLFVAAINGHSGARVTATDGTTTMTLTAKVVDNNLSVNAIDEYSQVVFDAFMVTDNFGACTLLQGTAPTMGYGNYKQVRDSEKQSLAYRGIKNLTQFPVIKPDMRVVKDETYDSIIIEHDKSYISSDDWNKEATLKTEIFIADGASQESDIIAVLNPWLESAGLDPISL